MLKPYIVYDEVSIDGGKWRKIDAGICYSLLDDKDANTRFAIDSASFMEFFNILKIEVQNMATVFMVSYTTYQHLENVQ